MILTTYEMKSGRTVICDPEDSDLLLSRSWYAHKSLSGFLARNDSPRSTYLHRLIAERIGRHVEISKIEFRDGNGLNCQRSNLKINLYAKILPDQIVFDDGTVSIFDPEDYDLVVANGPWNLFRTAGLTYVKQVGGRKTFLHRIITNAPNGMIVDHINRDGLDNRKSVNLRLATHHQNNGNIKKRSDAKTSEYRGVSWVRSHEKWRASIKDGPVHRTLGEFDNEAEAAMTYDEAAKRVFGAFANTNFEKCEHKGVYRDKIKGGYAAFISINDFKKEAA